MADRYQQDLAGFHSEILGRPPFWRKQLELSDLVVKHDEITVRSGNAVGKSYWLASAVLWWTCTRRDSLAVTTAPSQSLLGTVLWKEIRKAVWSARKRGWEIKLTTESPRTSPQHFEVPEMGSTALGISTTSIERLSGQHAGQVLVAVDEASGISQEIWEALDSLKFTKMITIGNPLKADGRFWELHRQADRETALGLADRVRSVKIASTEGPHAGQPISPWGLADRDWLDKMARRYGRDSNWWLSHVDAEFPAQSHDQLIPNAWLDALTKVKRSGNPGEPILSIDLAAGVGKDRTVLLVRDNLGILHLESSNLMSLDQAAQSALSLVRLHRITPGRLIYDAGGPGHDFHRYLDRFGLQGVPYHGGTRSGKRFANRRARCAWSVRRRLCPDPTWTQGGQPQPGFSVPNLPWWPSLREELAALRYEVGVADSTHLETKEAMASRLGRSPDLVDALLMSFALDPVDAD